MVDGLLGLRHHVVVGSDDDDGDVGHLGTTGTHGGEGFVTGCVEEGDDTTILQRHVVGTDVLRNTTGLTGNHVGLADVVEQRGLTVIDVTHHRHNRGTRLQILFGIGLFDDSLSHFGADILRLEAKLLGHQVDGLGIEALVDGYHDTHTHTGGNDLSD